MNTIKLKLNILIIKKKNPKTVILTYFFFFLSHHRILKLNCLRRYLRLSQPFGFDDEPHLFSGWAEVLSLIG